MLQRFILLLAIIASFTTPNFSLTETQEKQASLQLSRAFSAYYAEDFVQAIKAFEDYIKIKGEREVALRYLARIALANGDAERAIGYLERAIKLDTDNSYSLQLLSEIYLKKNRYDDAARVLQTILKDDPLNERALQILAYIYQQKQDLRQAATYYKRLIVAVQKGTGNPDLLVQALYFLGNYYYQQDNFFRSLTYFNKLHELDSENARYLLIIGELQKITGQFKDSIKTHEILVAQQPNFASAWESLAETYYILGDKRAQHAIQEYQKLKRKDLPDILRAIKLQTTGKDDEALKAFDHALVNNQNRLSARVGRYRIYENRLKALTPDTPSQTRAALEVDVRNEAFAVVIISQRLNAYPMAREYAHKTLSYLNKQAEKIKFRETFYAKTAHPLSHSLLSAEMEQLAIDFIELYTTHASTLENLGEKKASITYQELAAQAILELQIFIENALKDPEVLKNAEKKAAYEKRAREAKNQLYQTRVNQAWTRLNTEGQVSEAEKTADGAIQIEKDYATAWFVKGLIHNNIAQKKPNEYKAAAEYFKKAIQITEERSKKKVAPANYYFNLGMALEKFADFSEAEKELKRTIEIDPYNPTYLNYLGYMYSLRNIHLDEANTLVLRALEDDPENEAYLDTFGWIQFKLGHYREALEQLTVAASFAEKKKPVDSVIYFHLAEVHAKLINRITAIEYYQKTLATIDKASEPLDVEYIREQIKKLELDNKQNPKTKKEHSEDKK
ncbi:MAG: Lipopolysaccharide assembly protein B [Turneriella sp.]|nr:Lipopolysaccharide assembly protein B [Turneriella sp.]